MYQNVILKTLLNSIIMQFFKMFSGVKPLVLYSCSRRLDSFLRTQLYETAELFDRSEKLWNTVYKASDSCRSNSILRLGLQMWREESGFLEMFLAYYNQFEDLTGKKEYRDFLFDVLSLHEQSLT